MGQIQPTRDFIQRISVLPSSDSGSSLSHAAQSQFHHPRHMVGHRLCGSWTWLPSSPHSSTSLPSCHCQSGVDCGFALGPSPVLSPPCDPGCTHLFHSQVVLPANLQPHSIHPAEHIQPSLCGDPTCLPTQSSALISGRRMDALGLDRTNCLPCSVPCARSYPPPYHTGSALPPWPTAAH